MKKKGVFRLLETTRSHWYYIMNKDFPSGVEMPSSTNILEVYPNPQLTYWLTTTSPEEIEEKTKNGKRSGTKTHHSGYLLSLGDVINPNIGLTKAQIMKLPLETSEDKKKDDELLSYLMLPFNDREYRCLEGFKNFWEDFKPISILREKKVYHKKLLYAGTLDWAGYLWNSKKKKYEFWLIDYKISNSHDIGYEAQICSYYKALCQMQGRNIKARLGILYLGKTTKKRFQLKEVEDKNKAWDDFILAKKLWHSLYPNAKPTLKEPLENISVKIDFKAKGRRIIFK
jgi:hypothetical protein